MSTHNIRFPGEMRKISFGYPANACFFDRSVILILSCVSITQKDHSFLNLFAIMFIPFALFYFYRNDQVPNWKVKNCR